MSELKPLVLIVDDEDGLRFLLQTRLERKGYRVDFAANGALAYEKVTGGTPPDLIVSDMNMPDMSGTAFLEKVRELPSLKHTPFMMMTGFPEKKHIEIAQNLGVLEIFIKPFSYNDLVKKIDIFFELQRQNKPQDGGDKVG